MTDTDTLAQILAGAREFQDWTEAELDYHLATGNEHAWNAIEVAAYGVANPPPGPDAIHFTAEGHRRSRALLNELRPALAERIAKAKSLRYLGWSAEARAQGQRIRYARCEAQARKGTGTGMCDRPLDRHGNCDRAGDHITDEG